MALIRAKIAAHRAKANIKSHVSPIQIKILLPEKVNDVKSRLRPILHPNVVEISSVDQPTERPSNKPTNQPTNKPTNRSPNQPTNNRKDTGGNITSTAEVAYDNFHMLC